MLNRYVREPDSLGRINLITTVLHSGGVGCLSVTKESQARFGGAE